MFRIFFIPLLLITNVLFAVEINQLREVLNKPPMPFNYDIHIHVLQGDSPNENVTVCCHGFGGNYSIDEIIKSYHATPDHLVGFNFPDYELYQKGLDPSKICLGDIQELLPIAFILKRIIVDARADRVSLYGFSCGGGAVVNFIGILNTNQFDQELLSIGVDSFSKEKILTALQKGAILLDSPLKSFEEIMEVSGYDKTTQIIASRYKNNEMRPIDSLAKWKGLKMNVILFFQNPDRAVFNRDDNLFVQRLKQYNSGQNTIIIKNEGGHLEFHYSLWKAYVELEKSWGN